MVYSFIIFSKEPYKESYSFGNVFQIFPSEESVSEIDKPSDFHHRNILEINLDKFYSLYDEGINIQKIHNEATKINFGVKNVINLSEAAPLFHESHYIHYPKEIICRLLTLFTNHYHFDYNDTPTLGWFRKIPSESHEVAWGQFWNVGGSEKMGGFTNIQHEGITKVPDEDYYKRPLPSKWVSYPYGINDKFHSYFQLSEEDRDIFNSSIIFFYYAVRLRREMSSLSILSLTSSIENLVNFKHKDDSIEKCSNCGQLQFRVTKKFNDFMQENSKGFYSKNEIQKFIGDIYNLRSAIVHKGKVSEAEKNKPIWERRYFDYEHETTIGILQARYVLNNWLKEYYK